MKPKKFLLCENPFNDDGRVFILHTRHPLILAECFHFENDEPAWMECQQHFEIGSRFEYNGEYAALGCLWHETLTPSQDSANELASVMRKMADWYRAYIIWEDSHDADSN